MLSSLLSHIDVLIEGGSNFSRWNLTGFYGKPNTSKRVESWQLLNFLSFVSHLSWLIIGDFNEIRFAEEKEGGASRPYQQMAHFNSSINFCGLK